MYDFSRVRGFPRHCIKSISFEYLQWEGESADTSSCLLGKPQIFGFLSQHLGLAFSNYQPTIQQSVPVTFYEIRDFFFLPFLAKKNKANGIKVTLGKVENRCRSKWQALAEPKLSWDRLWRVFFSFWKPHVYVRLCLCPDGTEAEEHGPADMPGSRLGSQCCWHPCEYQNLKGGTPTHRVLWMPLLCYCSLNYNSRHDFCEVSFTSNQETVGRNYNLHITMPPNGTYAWQISTGYAS